MRCEVRITARPTAPSPNIATVDPTSTPATFHAAPTPVDTPQLRRQAMSSGIRGVILTMGDIHNSVFGEAGYVKEMMYNASLEVSEPACAVPRHIRAIPAAKFGASIALWRLAVSAFSTVSMKYRQHQISFFHFFHELSHALYYPDGFVSENHRQR